MEFVRLGFSRGSYSYEDCSNMKMCIIGRFLSNDVTFDTSSFRILAAHADWESSASNATRLEKENGLIMLEDIYSEEEVPTRVPFTHTQFIQLLDDWDAKVVKLRPYEVIIKCENNRFVFETTFSS